MATIRNDPRYMPVRGVTGLMLARKDNAWMAAIGLNDAKVCLFSPIKALTSLDCAMGQVSHLLAPNHFHNKGVASFATHYPRACVCAPKPAAPRLEQVTGLRFESLTSLIRRLPEGFDVLTPAGLKTGEVWLRFPVGKGRGWLVVDSFCGKRMTATSTTTKVPMLLGTFPSFAIADKGTYANWVLEQIGQDKPRLIIPCHGSVIRDAGLPAKLTRLTKTLL